MKSVELECEVAVAELARPLLAGDADGGELLEDE
jgi:hypothetical protein